MTTPPLPDVLVSLRAAGALSPAAWHFAALMARRSPDAPPLAIFGAAIAMRAVTLGHVCADLDGMVRRAPVGSDGLPVPFEWPDPSEWKEALRTAPFVGDAGDPDADLGRLPLVLNGARLYLTRYFRYERELAMRLLLRTEDRIAEIDRDALDAAIWRLFPDHAGTEELQARAARAAVESRLAIIAGGPGTGKTTAVARILALLLSEADTQPAPRVLLLAPTGKAAQRLAESISGAIERGIEVSPEVVDAIPREASTIHRALGVKAFSSTTFRHDFDNPLHADIVLVDEASMIDLALMSKLVAAVPPDARLIFLGDRDQLASVEAGAIFGDICLAGGDPTARIAESTVELTHRFRFAESSPIGALAAAIRRGDVAGSLEALPERAEVPEPAPPEVAPPPLLASTDESEDPSPPIVQRVAPLERGSPIDPVAAEIVAGYERLLAASTPEDALARLSDFRVLCAHRRGRFGVERVGDAIERLLVDRRLIPPSSRFGYTTDVWYPGRPVLVVQNDYPLELFNGDVGITLPSPGDPETLRVWFADPDGGVRGIQPARLPPHETCFAMTVHKSQGSEFDSVVVVLPGQASPIGTRELLYTAVTRARTHVTVLGSDKVIEDAVSRTIARASGLREVLGGV